jgi:hypothetical protein
VTALLELTLALAAAHPGPGQSPGDAGLSNVEQEASPGAPLVLGEALLEVDSGAQVVAGVFKRAGEVQQVDDGAGHSSDPQAVGRSSRPGAMWTQTRRA